MPTKYLSGFYGIKVRNFIYLRNIEVMPASPGAENCHADSSNKDGAISFAFSLPEK